MGDLQLGRGQRRAVDLARQLVPHLDANRSGGPGEQARNVSLSQTWPHVVQHPTETLARRLTDTPEYDPDG